RRRGRDRERTVVTGGRAYSRPARHPGPPTDMPSPQGPHRARTTVRRLRRRPTSTRRLATRPPAARPQHPGRRRPPPTRPGTPRRPARVPRGATPPRRRRPCRRPQSPAPTPRRPRVNVIRNTWADKAKGRSRIVAVTIET